MQKIIVKNFWIDPVNPPLSKFYEFSFGYNNKNKDFKYKVTADPNLEGSIEALHKMFWIIRDSKKGSYLPWTAVTPAIKSKLSITNTDDPQTSFLPELLSKVAVRLDVLNKLLRWL
jgi:hypothetical protein